MSSDHLPLSPLAPSAIRPFGVLDPSLANRYELLRDFVDFSNHPRFEGLVATGPDIETVLIVGPPGSGRSTYLQRAAILASQHPVADDGRRAVTCINSEYLPDTDLIRRVCDWYPPAVVVKVLQGIWRAATLRALIAHVLGDPRLGWPLGGTADLALVEFEPILDPDEDPARFPKSVYSQITNIVDTHEGADELRDYLTSPLWSRLEERLGALLAGTPPVVFYVDSFDEEFRHAPYQWMLWEKALFYQAFHFARSEELFPRFRLVASVRDLTYTAVREGASITKYGSPQVRVLRWTKEAASEFLRAKIGLLSVNWLMKPADEPVTAESWLGRSHVRNVRLETDEPVEEYIVSHTRYLPRDIVRIGDELSQEVEQALRMGATVVDEERIRAVVGKAATAAVSEQLRIAAADAASIIGTESLLEEFPEIDTGIHDDRLRTDLSMETLADEIERVARTVRFRFFSREMFERAFADSRLFGYLDLLSVLWRNGLVAAWLPTEEGMRPVFYTSGHWDSRTVSPDAEHFAFHRGLIEVLELDPGWSDESAIDDRTRLYVSGHSADAADIARLLRRIDEVYSGAFLFDRAADERAGVAEAGAGEVFAETIEAARGSHSQVRCELVPEDERLGVERVTLGSPGFWVFNGNGKALEFVRGILVERHERRKDREYREDAEKERMQLENELLRTRVVAERVELARAAGVEEADIELLAKALLVDPALRADDAHELIDSDSARVLEPGEPPTTGIDEI